MKNLAFLVLLIATLECNAHLSQLTGFLSGAHKHVHDRVHDVAGSILGGLNLNFQGHIDIGGQRYPNRPQQPPGQQETIVVVVDQTDGNGQNQPNQNGDGSYNNNYPRPGYNQGQWNGNYNNGNTPQHTYGNNQNHYGHHNYGNPIPNNNGHNNYDDSNQNNYGSQQHSNQEHNFNQQLPDHVNQNNNMRPNGQNQNNYQPDATTHKYPDQGNYGDSTAKPQEEQRPSFGNIHETTEIPSLQTDKAPGKDEPLFVPLNPNEYIYGGDKISINGPKRETDGDSKVDDDSYDIDVRFQDQ